MGPTGSGKKGDGGMEGDLEVQLSFVQVLLSCVPILCATLVAYLMDLSMTNMFVIGTVRTLVQLTVVGMILSTVFQVGEEHASLVIAYVAFMIIVVSKEEKHCGGFEGADHRRRLRRWGGRSIASLGFIS